LVAFRLTTGVLATPSIATTRVKLATRVLCGALGLEAYFQPRLRQHPWR